MPTETHPWHAILDDLIGYVRYHAETGARTLPGTPAVLAGLDANRQPAPTPAPAPPVSLPQIPAPPPPTIPKPAPPQIASCQLCPLCKTRKNVVPGQGNTDSPDILFIDEAPAPEDDATGIAAAPGAHQDLLRKMIKAMGYEPEQVFITTLCKCLPPDGARPSAESLDACRHHLDAQIAFLKPRVIVLLGAGATMGLLKKTSGSILAKTRGAWTRYNAIPVMPTYAPAYINKFPTVKPQVWKDLQVVMKHLGKWTGVKQGTNK